MTFFEELKARKSFLIILWISRAWETASELSVTEKNHHWREPSNEYRPPQRKRCYMASPTRSQAAQQIAGERQPLPSCLFSPVDFYSKQPFPTSFFSQQYCCPPSLAGLVNGFFFFFFPVFIEFVTIFLPLYVSWTFGHMARGTVVSWPGREPAPPTLEGKVWTTEPPGKAPCQWLLLACLSQIAIPLLFLNKHIFAGKVTFIFKVNTNFIHFTKRYI